MATEKSEAIIREMILFGVLVIRFVEITDLPRSVGDQLIRSATSIGANFSEAQEASSKKDFVNKIYIAKKEASETKYWLRLAAELTKVDQELNDNAQKFLMILQKIVSTSRGENGK